MKLLLSLTLIFASMALLAQSPKEVDKIGVVLSGGAARGFAHLGALQALEDNGIIPAYISGASMGAVLGSIYASGMPPKQICDFARKQNYLRLLAPAFNGGVMKSTFIQKMLDQLIPHNSFDSLQKQLFVSVTNLNLAGSEIISTGDLKRTVRASAAIPVVFEPVKINNTLYVDGGMLNNLPVEPLLDLPECKYIIGISVTSTPELGTEKIKGFETIFRVMDIVVRNTELANRQKCTFFIEVRQATRYRLIDFGRVEEFYEIGYQAVSEYIHNTPALQELAYKEASPL